MSGAANGQQDVVMGNETTKNGKKTSGKQSVSNTKKFIQISQNQIIEGPRKNKNKDTCNEVAIMNKQIRQERIPEKKEKKEKKKVEDTKMEVDQQPDSHDPSDPYSKIKILTTCDDEIQCDICLEFDHEDDDQLVICELCNCATHQKCYGGNIYSKLP